MKSLLLGRLTKYKRDMTPKKKFKLCKQQNLGAAPPDSAAEHACGLSWTWPRTGLRAVSQPPACKYSTRAKLVLEWTSSTHCTGLAASLLRDHNMVYGTRTCSPVSFSSCICRGR